MARFKRLYNTLGTTPRDPDLPLEFEPEQTDQFTGLTGASKDVYDYLSDKFHPLAMESKEDQTPINLMEKPDAPLRALESAGKVQDIPAGILRKEIYKELTGRDKDEVSGEDLVSSAEERLGAVPEMPGASLKMRDSLPVMTEIGLDPSLIAGATIGSIGNLKRWPLPQRIEVNPRMEFKSALESMYKERPRLNTKYGPKTAPEGSEFQTTEDIKKFLEGEKTRQQKMEKLSSTKPTNPSEFWHRGQTAEFSKPDFGKPYGPDHPKSPYREDMNIILDKLKDDALTTDEAAEKLKRLYDVDDNNINNFISKLFASKIDTETTIPKLVKKAKENLDRSDPEYFNKLLKRSYDLIEQKSNKKGGIKAALLESED